MISVSTSLHADTQTLADRLEVLLPQTQCTKCGFDGCRPYAEAMARGEADVNRCPPGGQAGVATLAQVLAVPEPELDVSRGEHGPLQLAVIDENHCIGCTLCIQACPVDAIVGANLRMHTVLPEQCTGCDLCVAPCPVDCIDMVPVEPMRWWNAQDASMAFQAHQARQERLARLEAVAHSKRPDAADVATAADAYGPAEGDGATSSTQVADTPTAQVPATDPAEARRAAVAAALARARARRQSQSS